jgi:hypothetical protein
MLRVSRPVEGENLRYSLKNFVYTFEAYQRMS